MQIILPLACLSGAFAAVLELPIWVRNSYTVVEVKVGTPPVSHFLQFDTGSATTWMDDASCAGTDACPNSSGYTRVGYNASGSSTSAAMNTTASADYLGGDISGSGFLDSFTLPSAPSAKWTQSFMSVDNSTWSTTAADGFLGLAFSTIDDAGTTSLVETLMQDGKLDKPRFGLYLGSETNDTGAGAGSGLLTLGSSHETTYGNGSLTWIGLQNPGPDAELWRTNIQYLVGTTSTGNRSTTQAIGDWAVFDTGAGRISVPDELIDDIYASIGMNYTAIINGETIPLCEDFTDAWGLEVVLGSAYDPQTVTVTGSMLKQPGFATGEDKYCWPPFDTTGFGGLFLFGQEFLQNFYTVFDFGAFNTTAYNAQIGFAPLKEEYRVLV
ncbi:pepsinogen c [Grosmannia clavigera kw1407]|uniref:Pepsinogen c n=1 Tax=Grosmannia clavigera (strain kw1407 / UAMH 11150) TaxID=655863 RepID=F0XQU5_GROCL|nr:pepsinogen c [Grosmannia clavigera kw1407]EFX00006.1 pepsinogen c [Grosmannia clavigera kw1407]